MSAFEETEKMKNQFTDGLDEKRKAWGRDRRVATCCNCREEIIRKPIPGPPDFPPFSCGKPECDKERVRRIHRQVG